MAHAAAARHASPSREDGEWRGGDGDREARAPAGAGEIPWRERERRGDRCLGERSSGKERRGLRHRRRPGRGGIRGEDDGGAAPWPRGSEDRGRPPHHGRRRRRWTAAEAGGGGRRWWSGEEGRGCGGREREREGPRWERERVGREGGKKRKNNYDTWAHSW
ncbi:hypothetical protein PVAP13_6NG040583 [Panicum virgatum]|uniref:Uncharacterized protein n=1 Tax=Panicum virgatum TaxID=38727 RepID=A0A8T0QTK4_PANVG|nr:hypothetical protein PVAP13_6NG040583 [Panicum virgatum]